MLLIFMQFDSLDGEVKMKSMVLSLLMEDAFIWAHASAEIAGNTTYTSGRKEPVCYHKIALHGANIIHRELANIHVVIV